MAPRLIHALPLALAGLLLGPAPASALDPLPQEAVDAFSSIQEDPPPENITRNSHYWISNEFRHDLFKSRIENTGGVYIGVGTDQNYLIAGWSRPEVLVLMDFDGMIPRVHDVYRVMFGKADTPEDFVSLWEEKRFKEVNGWLDEAYAEDKARLKDIKRAFKVARPLIRRRLRLTKKAYKKMEIGTFITDAEQYAWIKDLYAKNRVYAMRGDLTANKTLQDIAKAAKTANLPVRVLYMSNAEQYFDYKEGFKANMAALPFDEQSTVLHTLGWSVFGYADGHYHYNWIPGPLFQAWLAETRIPNFGRLLNRRTKSKDEEGLSFFDMTPEAWKAKKAKRKARRAKKKRKAKKKAAQGG